MAYRISRVALIAALVAASALAAIPARAQMQSSTPNGGDQSGGTTKLAPPVTGEQVYHQVCQACHMADAKGASGAGMIPALANNPRLASAAYPITLIIRGRGAMPALGDLLGPAQIANVVTYIRTNFGNAYPAPVTEDDVKRLTPAKKAP